MNRSRPLLLPLVLHEGPSVRRLSRADLKSVHSSRSEPYDPYIPGSNPNAPAGGPGPNPSSSASSSADPRTAAIQQQINDTVGIMRDNISKVAERGERLDVLQDKTGERRPTHSPRLAHDPPFSFSRLTRGGPPSDCSPRHARAKCPGIQERSQQGQETNGKSTKKPFSPLLVSNRFKLTLPEVDRHACSGGRT